MSEFEISIPTDNEGFMLLKCPLCGEYFKLHPSEINADDVIEIWCPCCGLKAGNYLTPDVMELALRIAKNIINNTIYEGFRDLERQTKGNMMSFKVGKKPDDEPELPIMRSIDEMVVEKYACCNREAKIKPIIKMYGSYCPYCGVKQDENK
jgi:DNA-directed RNA polymerase subunit RPC12/RpoP